MDFDVNEDFKNKPLFCICCMEKSGKFIRLASCAHKEYLESFPIPDLNLGIPIVVCSKCHDILKTVTNFKEQVRNSFNILLKQVNSSKKFDSKKSNLQISDTLQFNIPEIIDQVDNKSIESVPENSRKLKNISTALEIINSNAKSMKTLTSYHNFIGLTETLLEATSLGFNLPLKRETVLPEVNIIKLTEKHDSTAMSAVELREDNATDVLPIDRIPANNVFNTEELIEFDNGTCALSVCSKKETSMGLDTPRAITKYNKIKSDPEIEIIHEKLRMAGDNIDDVNTVLLVNNKLPDTDEKFRKLVNNREARISKHFDNGTTVLPIDIKKEPETIDPLDILPTNNENQIENNYHEISVKTDIEKEIDEVDIVGVYGTVLPDGIKCEPENFDGSCIHSDASTGATSSNHTNVNDDADIIPETRSLTGLIAIRLGDEELIKEREEKLYSTEFLRWNYRCNHCIIGFQYKENLDDHVKRKHETKLPPQEYATCETCQQVVPVIDFKEHHSRHYNRLECEKCKKRFVLFDEAFEHYRIGHKLSTSKHAIKRRWETACRSKKKQKKGSLPRQSPEVPTEIPAKAACYKKLTNEQTLEKKRQAERLRYQKIKKDPKKYELQKQKHRQTYLKRKEDGIIKTVDVMTPRERREARKLWKRKARERRQRLANAKVTNATITPSIMDEHETIELEDKHTY